MNGFVLLVCILFSSSFFLNRKPLQVRLNALFFSLPLATPVGDTE